MKDMFYLMDASQMKDGTNPVGVFSYEESEQAVMVYHQTIASKMANQDVEYAVIQLMGTAGNIIMTETVKHKTEE